MCYLITVLVFSLDFLYLWAVVSIIRLLQVPTLTSLSPTRLSSGLFVAWQKILDQPSIAVIRLLAKDNAFSKKKKRFFLLAHCWLVSILLFCLYVFYGVFLQFCHYEMMNQKLLLFFSVSEEAKFEIDATSIILSY